MVTIEINKVYIADTMDVIVFDSLGNEVANLATTDTVDVLTDTESCYINIKDVLFNLDLIKYLGTHKSKSSYERHLDSRQTVAMGSKQRIDCRVILKTYLMNPATNSVAYTQIMEFPKAAIKNNFEFNSKSGSPVPFNFFIEAEKFNTEGDYFLIHLDENKQ